MQNNNPLHRNPNKYPNNPQPNRQQMEEEYSAALIFKPIEKEKPDDRLKQKVIELQCLIKTFSQKINDFDYEGKMKKLNKHFKELEEIMNCDQFFDWEQLKIHLESLKELYLKNDQNFTQQIKIFSDASLNKGGDLTNFLKKISSFEVSYQECQSLLFLEQELGCLEKLICVLKPKVQQYKEVIYYEKADPPIQEYKKKKVEAIQQTPVTDLKILIGLLNKYYKFGALPNKQDRYVSFVSWTPESNWNDLKEYQELILIFEILEDNQKTYAILLIQTQQNEKVCQFKSEGKMRHHLQQLSQQLGCNRSSPPTLIAGFTLNDAIQEFFKIVAPKFRMENLNSFIQENHYLILENKNDIKDIKDKQPDYFVDVFEMERQGFKQVNEKL